MPASPFVILVLTRLPSSNVDLPRLGKRRLITVTKENVRKLLCSEVAAAGSVSSLGLAYLVEAVSRYTGVVVKVWNVSKKELLSDLKRAPQFDQTSLFRRAYSECIGSFGGEPIGCILADWYQSAGDEDIELATLAGRVAASVGSPLFIGVGPQFLHLDSWSSLNPDFSPDWVRGSPFHAGWWALRNSKDAVFLVPVAGEFRVPGVAGGSLTPWLNPVYLVGSELARVFGGRDLLEVGHQLLVQPNTANVERVELECDFSENLVGKLKEVGLNAFTADTLIAGNLRLFFPAEEKSHKTVGFLLLFGALNYWWRDYLRRVGRSYDSATSEDVENWLDRLIPIGDDEVRNSTSSQLRSIGGLVSLEPCYDPGPRWNRLIRNARPYRLPTRFVLFTNLPTGRGGARPFHYGFGLVPLTQDNLDAVLRDWSQSGPFDGDHFNISLAAVMEDATGGTHFDLTFNHINNFEPIHLATRIEPLRELLEDRRNLVALGFLANLSDEHAQNITHLMKQSGRSTDPRMGAVTLLDSGNIATTLDASSANETSGNNGFGASSTIINTVERWARRRHDLTQIGAEAIITLIEEIDRILNRQLMTCYRDPHFRMIERYWRAFEWLVINAGPSNVRMDLAPISMKKSSDLHAFFSKLRKLSDFYIGETRSSPIIVLDYPILPGTREFRGLKRILRTRGAQEFLTVIALARKASDTTFPDAQLLDLVGSQSSRRLILVEDTFVVRAAHKSTNSHPAFFNFDAGTTAPFDEDLRASAVYQAVVAVVRAIDRAGTCEHAMDSDLLNQCSAELNLQFAKCGHAVLASRIEKMLP